MRKKAAIVSVALALGCMPGLALGDLEFSYNMESGAAWTVNGTADTASTFNYDYSADGIPEAPNTAGGDAATRGLKLEANISSGTVSEIVATPTGVRFSGVHTIEFDYWINANGPFPAGGGGSTEYIGGGAGYDGVTAGRDSAVLLVTGEGGASRDYRMYKNTGEQWPASGQYAAGTYSGSNNAADPYYLGTFPGGLAAPLSQQTAHPQQTGTTGAGAHGFAWHHMRIEVDPDAIGVGVTADPGVTMFYMDDLLIGHIDNSNGGTVVDMTGNVECMYGDLFSSVSDNPALSFGIIDNFYATPEPASLALLALGSLALLRRRF
jgi:hypothetical protein